MAADRAESPSPTDRGALARARADELRERSAELVAGIGATVQSVELARLRADQALDRSRNAHHAAADRHSDAGVAHRRAAAAHEQAVIHACGGSDDDDHQDAAELHRDAARRQDAAATEERDREAQVLRRQS